MKKRRIKRQHWGWIAAATVILLILAIPLDVFVRLVYETQQKVAITEELLITLTGTVKVGASLMTAVAALIFYKVVKK
ncbi:hypothetical protein LCGC14_1909510 [marine sediment metagenome]|uniref:Uncharacterized protein n=1 Tax=marine sediment metagenome TaxID=412755 RepID=A0A0F9GHC4_9ZZZZ